MSHGGHQITSSRLLLLLLLHFTSSSHIHYIHTILYIYINKYCACPWWYSKISLLHGVPEFFFSLLFLLCEYLVLEVCGLGFLVGLHLSFPLHFSTVDSPGGVGVTDLLRDAVTRSYCAVTITEALLC